MALVYNHLFDLLRKERAHQDLQEMPADFYEQARAFLQEQREAAQRDPFSAAGEAARLQLTNGRKLLKQLYDYREQKILLLAQSRVRTGSALVETNKLLAEEKALYDSVVHLLSATRRELGQEERAAEEEPAKVRPAPLQATSPATVDRVRVRVIKSVPQFVGKEMETYGPFEENESVELPQAVAQVLIRKGAVQPAED
jgi:DNA replication initiation complex subunit (GINS family)